MKKAFFKIREKVGRVKEKFEERVVKVCGEYLHDHSGIGKVECQDGKGRRRGGR